MIGLAIRFDLGRYHATPWRTNVNEAMVEWPPSPWRLLRALIAAACTDLTLLEHREQALSAVAALAQAGAPSYQLPAAVPGHTRHYFPALRAPFDPTAKVLDSFLAIEPDAPLTAWWNVALGNDELAALRDAAGSLRYMGRSESLCSARVLTEPPPSGPGLAEPLTPDRGQPDCEIVYLLSPESTLKDPIEMLSATPDEARAKGLRLPSGARRIPYVVPTSRQRTAKRADASKPTIAIFRLIGGSRPPLKKTVVVASAIRGLIQRAHDRDKGGARSPTFSGHGKPGKRQDQHQHAHYIPLPDADRRRVGRVAIWAPEGFGESEVATLAQPQLTLRLRGNPEGLPLTLASLGETKDLILPELIGPSPRWRSLTPFGLVRHPKRRGGRIVDSPEEQIRTELKRRGLPDPLRGDAGVHLIKGPWQEFARARPGKRMEATRVVGAVITFEESVRGPLALGAMSHFGLGLFEPDGTTS